MRRAAFLILFLALAAQAADPGHARHVKLTVTIATADGQDAELWAALPLELPSVQTSSEKGLRHGSGKTLTYAATVERHEQRAPEGALASTATELSAKEKADLAAFLRPEKGNEPDADFTKLARSIAPGEKSFVKVARAIYEHVLANMKYDKPAGKGWGRGSVQWACAEKYGNCTDFHALFMNLCRVRGIPARFTMGLALPKDAKGKLDGYHCWCEFYVPGSGWVPVDASEAWNHPEKKDYLFGALDEDRVAFVAGRDLTLEPAQKAGPVSILAIGYAERDGKPVAIKRSIEFQNVE